MRLSIVITMLLFTSLSPGCAIYHHYGEFTGRVIDVDTKEPLEGAAVLAVYRTELYTLAGKVGKHLNAQETVTDKNGEFKIPSNNTFAFRPLNLFDPDVMFTIFKPGYGYYPMHPRAEPLFVPNGSLPPSEYISIALPKLQTGERFPWPSVDHGIAYEKQKRFIGTLNEDRKQFGVDLYSEEDFKRR